VSGPDANRPRTTRLELPADVRRIELRPLGDGPVDISDYALVGAGRGVTLANLGFPGAQIGIMARWDAGLVAEQLALLNPALIIVAFGTNEGFASAGRMTNGYTSQFEQRLLALRAAAPNASIVVVGPPDANRYPRYCLPPPPPLAARRAVEQPAEPAPGAELLRHTLRVGAISAAWPPSEPPESAKCQPLTPDERASYDALIAAQDSALCRWHTPAAIPVVREAQRSVAARLGVLFFDWSVLFDGECGADRWARRGLAHKDRVHFKQEGYARAADRLFEILMAGYAPAPRGR
jgi:lysophospholipase L1-like esterase